MPRWLLGALVVVAGVVVLVMSTPCVGSRLALLLGAVCIAVGGALFMLGIRDM